MPKILVVDDDRGYLDAVQDLLKSESYEVEICNDPLKAVDLLDKNSVQCVLLDYHMPGMDGEDLLHLIHSKYPEIPVIICSGYLGSKDHYLMHEGAYDILIKPFDNHVLSETLTRAMATGDETTPILIDGFNLRSAKEGLFRKLIIKALSRTEFNITQAAKLLGISRQHLMRYMKLFQIHS